ncbi:filamentous hemagglutinin family N-terminal domain-containing protein [Selenomonas sp. GACV-9]|uniref:filamentous hemagglutinin N-terminal domain-containing protein n=1 Tax=Selenomonas sp. GACV-9 TaxID=3158782 RepID=UPI0008F3CE1F|nr:filamentous hemagglutinin family N-terminal domain-containing protein [Selenomonas ruminantium]
MKMNKKMREAALTAMITLALSGSAMAMPSGGTVTQGNVTVNGAAASAIDSVANGATIAANAHSIIDWKAFGIEAGQKLNFDTTNGALLNRVIGSDMSKILGTLTQKGSNPLLLVNPNGILVGNGAVINASQLVLSTLAISNDDFNKFANQGVATFATDSKGAGSVMVEKGAAINIDEVLLMAGGTVNVADGVTFTTNNTDDAMVEIAAANSIKVDRTQKLQDSMDGIVTTKDNAVSFHGTFDSTKASGNANFHIDGGTVNLDNAQVKLNDKSEAYLVAGNKAANSATTDNVISGKKASIEGGKEAVVGGGKVTFIDSSIKNHGRISIVAGTSFKRENDSKNDSYNIVTATATPQNEVTIINSSVENTKKSNIDEIQINGGKITLDKATAKSDESIALVACNKRLDEDFDGDISKLDDGNIITIKNGSNMTTANVTIVGKTIARSDSAKMQITSSEEPVIFGKYEKIADSVTTGYALAPEAGQAVNNNSSNSSQPTFASDKENVNAGAQTISAILSTSNDVADRQEAIVEYVGKLNTAEGSDRAKAAQVYGMLKALESLKSSEGNVLMLTVLNAYEPTKNAKAQAEQSKTAEGKTVAAQTTDAQTVQATTGANESANDVAVDASAVEE